VLACGGKVAGILSEAVSSPAGVEWVVLGVGVNVALDPADLPLGIQEGVTSLAAEGATGASVPTLAAAVLARLAVCYDALRSRPGDVVASWRSRSASWWGGWVDVRTGGGSWRGRLLEVDDEGALVIEVEGGGTRRFLSGEVTRVRPSADP